MTVEDVRNCLLENRIDQLGCRINPTGLRPGALDIYQEAPNRWVIRRNDRGEEGFLKVFTSEDEACREYLWLVLSEPTYRLDFKQKDLLDYTEKVIPVLRKYGLPPIDYGTAHLSSPKRDNRQPNKGMHPVEYK